jgi:hypothetical protein
LTVSGIKAYKWQKSYIVIVQVVKILKIRRIFKKTDLTFVLWFQRYLNYLWTSILNVERNSYFFKEKKIVFAHFIFFNCEQIQKCCFLWKVFLHVCKETNLTYVQWFRSIHAIAASNLKCKRKTFKVHFSLKYSHFIMLTHNLNVKKIDKL